MVGGFIAGIINTVAGGGSIITLPLLIFAGLPPSVANGTNRVAIVLQNVGALAGFKRHGFTVGRSAWRLLIPSVAGALIGVFLALHLDESQMRRVIGLVLVVMLIPLLRRNRPQGAGAVDPPVTWWTWPAYFLVGVYGGFLQAGVGFMYLALLVGGQGLDLIRANVLKVFFILVYTVIALAIFALSGKVEVAPGIALAIGTTAGGWLGARLAVRRGEAWIRVILVAAIFVAALKLLGVIDLVWQQLV